MFSPCLLNSRLISFLVRSDCGPLAFLRRTSPSSLSSPTLFLPYLSLRISRRKSPISSQKAKIRFFSAERKMFISSRVVLIKKKT